MYRIMKNGKMIGLSDEPAYIRKQANGSYGFCRKEDAQGVAVDSMPYHLEGKGAMEGVETVTIEHVVLDSIVSDFQVASHVYASQADAGNLEQKEISLHPDLFPRLNGDGNLVKVGTHINWHGIIKRAAVDLWDTENNTPDNAPALWEDIDYREGYRIIPKTITAGTAFAQDECGWWEDILYKSLIDSNVWTPAAYPAGWEAQ